MTIAVWAFVCCLPETWFWICLLWFVSICLFCIYLINLLLIVVSCFDFRCVVFLNLSVVIEMRGLLLWVCLLCNLLWFVFVGLGLFVSYFAWLICSYYFMVLWFTLGWVFGFMLLFWFCLFRALKRDYWAVWCYFAILFWV